MHVCVCVVCMCDYIYEERLDAMHIFNQGKKIKHINGKWQKQNET